MAIDLKSISRDPVMAPPRIIVYGPHKIGKTTFGAGAPSPIVISTEEGIGRLDVPHFPVLTEYAQVIEALGALYQEEHEYATVVVDSADWLEPIVWREICRRKGWQDVESPGYGKGYLAALDVWREVLAGANALRAERGMCVVFLAHAEIKRFDAPDTDPFDRYQIKLQPRAAALLEEWADAVLFANYRTYVQKTDVGFNKSVTRGVGVGERLLFTEERPAFKAGNRYSLPPELPLSWAAFQAALGGAEAEPEQASEASEQAAD